MSAYPAFDEQFLQRLPLPLAQLCRRSQNAKTPLEQHLAAYYLWEASLKLLGAAAVVEFAEAKERDPQLVEKLKNLARPAVGHWWEFVRRLVPVLADKGDKGFANVRDLVLGPARDDMPRAAGLFAALTEELEGKAGARTTVRLTELFDRLVAYRNREIGHGAAGQRPMDFYRRTAQALTMGFAQILAKLDVVAGRRIVYIGDVRRLAHGGWLIERYVWMNETPRRLEPLQLTEKETAYLPRPECVYLEGQRVMGIASPFPTLRSLHPLVHFNPDAGKLFFLNARRGKKQVEYLCYSTGEVLLRDIATDQRELLSKLLNQPIDAAAAEVFATRSLAEETAETVAAVPAGKTIGEYELLSRLGQGGMGIVYRAWQPSLGRQVALKCMLRVNDPKGEARFAREIRALGRVEHANVVKVFTSGSEGDQWFYAMELIEGAELSRVCEHLTGKSAADIDAAHWRTALTAACAQVHTQETPLGQNKADTPQIVPMAIIATPAAAATPATPPAGALASKGHIRQMVDIMREVADAVHALHEAGVVHRDIKPGNIMLPADGSHPVLMDLGLAQLADETQGKLTRTRQFIGTLRYASPEQILAVGQVDRRTDVYSLGVTLWELLTLRPAYGADDSMSTPDLMLKIQSNDLENPRKYNRHVPRDLRAIVMKCVEKDRTRRYATAGDVAADLQRFLNGEPVSAQPPSLNYVMGKFIRRHQVPLGVAAGVLLVLLTAAIVAFIRVDAARQDAVAAQGQEKEQREKAEQNAAAADKNAIEADRKGKEAALERQRTDAFATMLGRRLLRKNLKQDDPNAVEELLNIAALAENQLSKDPRDEIKFELADTYESLSQIYKQRQDLAKAAQALEKCTLLQISLAKKTPLLMVNASLNFRELGGMYGTLGDPFKELESDLKALELLQNLGAKGFNNATIQEAMSQAHLVLGLDFQKKGEQDKTLNHFNESVRILKQLTDGGEATASWLTYQTQLGKAYQQLGIAYLLDPAGTTNADAENAIMHLNNAAEIMKGKSQHRMALAEVNRWQCTAFLKLDKLDEALAAANKGSQLVEEVARDFEKSPQLETVLRWQVYLFNAQAKAHQKRKEHAQARDFFEKSLSLYKKEKFTSKSVNAPPLISTLQELANCLAEEKKWEGAHFYIKQAIENQERYVEDAPKDYERRTTAGNMHYFQGWFYYNQASEKAKDAQNTSADIEKIYKSALEAFGKAKKHEREAFALRGGKDYGANLFQTYSMEFNCLIGLRDFAGALKSVKERIEVGKSDRQKYLLIAKDLNYLLSRDATQAGPIANIIEAALRDKLFDVAKLKTDAGFEILRSEPILQELIAKYAGK